jgi:DNA invertase Pin-like site-specific DNA recombinase
MFITHSKRVKTEVLKIEIFFMIYGYVRVSKSDQNVESQKNVISRYGVDCKIIVDEWIEVEMSSRRSTKIEKLMNCFKK